MFRVTQKQMASIRQAVALEIFEDQMIPHLQDFSPHDARMLGATGLCKVVRLGIQRAAAYGLTNPGLLRFFVDLMFEYGSFFDTDPCLPWASEVLLDDTIHDHQVRMNKLHERMSWYYDTIGGGGDQAVFDREALRRCEDVFVDGCTSDHPAFESKLITRLFTVHSRRAAYLGEDRLQGLVQRAVTAARQLKVGTADGVCLVAFLMFTKGHGFAEDPVLPWVRAALSEEEGQDEPARAKRLEHGFYGYRERVFAPLT